MSMIRFNPFKELDSWFDIHNHALMNSNSKQSNISEWNPRVDIVEGEKDFTIKAELAGVAKEDLELHVENHILTLSGERKTEVSDEKKHRTERFFGRFSRSFSLPESIDETLINAQSKDGMLLISLPKKPMQKSSQQVEIH